MNGGALLLDAYFCPNCGMLLNYEERVDGIYLVCRWCGYSKLLRKKPIADRKRRVIGRVLRNFSFFKNEFDLLHPFVRKLLEDLGIRKPTSIQRKAIPCILRGENVLLMSPTGSGKTEAVFAPLFSILLNNKDFDGVKILYISPFRALARNMYKRLKTYIEKLGGNIRIEMWTRDVSEKERIFIEHLPPTILITTPESLEVILDTRFGFNFRLLRALFNVKHVVVDEVHELAYNKRGIHLAILLERIKHFVNRSFQRICLSATVPKPEQVAEFFGGSDGKLKLIRGKEVKRYKLVVQLPEKEDLKQMSDFIIDKLREVTEKHKSKSAVGLAFTNTRYMSELLTRDLQNRGIEDIAVYHSSLSKDIREEVESKLENKQLSLVVCTRALELGVDYKDVMEVVQISSPSLLSYLIQRMGRGGHKPREVSKGRILTTDPLDALEVYALLRLAEKKSLEKEEHVVLDLPLDVALQTIQQMLFQAYNMRNEQSFSSKKLADWMGIKEPEIKIDVPKTCEDVIDRSINILSKLQIFKNIKQLKEYICDLLLESGLIFCIENFEINPNRMRWIWAGRTKKSIIYGLCSYIPPNFTFKVNEEKKEIGDLDWYYAITLRKGSVFWFAGKRWEVKGIRYHIGGGRIYVKECTEEEMEELPFWRGGGVDTDKMVAEKFYELVDEIYREYVRKNLFDKLSLKIKRFFKNILYYLGKNPVKIEDEGKLRLKILKDLRKIEEPIPSKEILIVELSKDKLTLLHPFGSKIARTLLDLILIKMGNGKGGLIKGWYPKPYGIYLRFQLRLEDIFELLYSHSGKTIFDIIFAELENLDKSEVEVALKERLKDIPFINKQIYEVCRAFGYTYQEARRNEDVIREAIRQVIQLYYDIDGAVKLIKDVREGRVKVIQRNLTSLSKFIFKEQFKSM